MDSPQSRRRSRPLLVIPALVFALSLPLQALGAAPADVAARAQARAEGNDRARAVVLGEALLETTWPAQVLKIRVDAVQGHRVAGITVSGTKFHGTLGVPGFLREVQQLVTTAFARAPVEEVDLWATIPVDAGKGAIVSGDLAQPTSRTVFSVTVRRADLPRLTALLHSDGVYWDASWLAELQQQ